MKSRDFCDKPRKHLSHFQGVRNLEFLMTVLVVIPVIQEELKNRYSSWKNKLLFMYDIPVLQLMKNGFNAELKTITHINQL